jgi:hypothetical protein
VSLAEVPVSLRELYETDDPGFAAYVWAVLEDAAQMREEAAAKHG